VNFEPHPEAKPAGYYWRKVPLHNAVFTEMMTALMIVLGTVLPQRHNRLVPGGEMEAPNKIAPDGIPVTFLHKINSHYHLYDSGLHFSRPDYFFLIWVASLKTLGCAGLPPYIGQ
jgi:hypothetical protein